MRKVIIIGRKNGLLFSSSSILHNIQFREFHHDIHIFAKCQNFVNAAKQQDFCKM